MSHLEFLRHLSEQYLTSFHTALHFLRQANGLLQTIQIFVGRSDFLIIYTVQKFIRVRSYSFFLYI